MQLFLIKIYIISIIMLLLFVAIDFLIEDIVLDRQLEIKATRILLGSALILMPIINTFYCIYYATIYYEKTLSLLIAYKKL